MISQVKILMLSGGLALSLAGNLWAHLDRSQLQRDLARAEKRLAIEREQAATALAEAAQQAREIEAQWRQKHEEVQTHAQAQIKAAQADSARARSAADGLLRRAETLATQCALRPASAPTADPVPPSGGPSAPDAGALLADVLGRLAATAGQLASIADARGAAGAACESAYGNLSR